MTSRRKHKRAHQEARRGLPLGLMQRLGQTGTFGGPPMYYVLRGRKARPAHLWQVMHGTKGRFTSQVADTRVGLLRVSTIFLSLDHGFIDPRPVLFETMVFGPGSYRDLDQDRYYTYREAMAGHRAIVAKLRRAHKPMKTVLASTLKENE